VVRFHRTSGSSTQTSWRVPLIPAFLFDGDLAHFLTHSRPISQRFRILWEPACIDKVFYTVRYCVNKLFSKKKSLSVCNLSTNVVAW
jgi:hypothetical protein